MTQFPTAVAETDEKLLRATAPWSSTWDRNTLDPWVLRLILEIDGETIVRMRPEIGYLHTGIEKTCEAKFYQQVVPLTDRIDYLCP